MPFKGEGTVKTRTETFLYEGTVEKTMDSRQVIETGVDKLVELLKKKGRMSFQDAAKELGVGVDVIAEWADFLSEEGILGVEYRFTTPFLIDRKISREEMQKKTREFEDKKDIFVRNAEGTVSVLRREAENMKRIKTEFESLKKGLGIGLDSIRKEVTELENLEQMKEGLSKKLLEEKREAEKRGEEVKAIIERERRMYEQLQEGIKGEEAALEQERSTAKMLGGKEKTLLEGMDTLKGIIKELDEKMAEEGRAISGSEKHIAELRTLVESIRDNIEKERASLTALVTEKEQHEKVIKELQDTILKKLEKIDAPAEESASKRLREFFHEKMKVSLLVEKLNEDRDRLEKDFMELIRKAKAFQLTAKGKDIQKEMEGIEDKFQDMEKRKGVFEEEFRKLSGLIRAE